MTGWSARFSTAMKTAISTTPTANETRTTGSPHEFSETRMKPWTRAVIPTVEVSAPAMSKRPGLRPVSSMKRGASATTSAPNGMLMKSTQRQESPVVRTPPRTRPSARPEPATVE